MHGDKIEANPAKKENKGIISIYITLYKELIKIYN